MQVVKFSCVNQPSPVKSQLRTAKLTAREDFAPVVDIILHQPVLHRQLACGDHNHKTIVLFRPASAAGTGEGEVRSRVAWLTMAVLR